LGETILKLKNIDKTFPGVKALDNVFLEIKKKEVHVIMGENGAGKSTLMKIIAGVYSKDKGEIIMNGNKVEPKNTKESENLGIRMIHQELNLIPDLTIAENIFIGRLPQKAAGIVDWKKLRNMTKNELEDLNLDFDPFMKVKDLSVAEKQMVEIIKAISFDAKIIIMDEPTSSITQTEVETLFRQIELLKERNVSIIYISHKIPEVKEIGDRITVLRDGKYIGTKENKNIDENEIIKMMVGRELKQYSDIEYENTIGEEVISIENVSGTDFIDDVSFSVRKGEVLGFSGLVGSGRTELMRLIFGADNKKQGKIFINNQEATIKSPQDAIKYGLGFLTEDRQKNGFIANMPIDKNITLSSMKNYTNNSIINHQKEEEDAKLLFDKLDIRAPGVNTIVDNLSGGNKQKVVFAKWICRDSDILILDEPTRGIDVGAKNEIYELINELKRNNKAIILISSEMPEILGISDRIAVMSEGKLTGILDKKSATQEKIMELATIAM